MLVTHVQSVLLAINIANMRGVVPKASCVTKAMWLYLIGHKKNHKSESECLGHEVIPPY